MFQIIGEKINGTRKSVRSAIEGRDAEAIGSLARRQAEAGAHWIDLNTGTHPDREIADLTWLVETVQAAVDLPLCLDSPNPASLAAAIAMTGRPPLINSISGDQGRRAEILQLVKDSGASVVALALGAGGMPVTIQDRLDTLEELVTATRAVGIEDDRVFLDPLVLTIATDTSSAGVVLDTIRRARAAYPDVHISCGLSNVSFGLPVRSLINRTFLTLAVEAGLDAAIVDPLDRELKAALLATELLLGQDRRCLSYTRAFRSGLLGVAPTTTSPSSA